jgi:hypothetical protein
VDDVLGLLEAPIWQRGGPDLVCLPVNSHLASRSCAVPRLVRVPGLPAPSVGTRVGAARGGEAEGDGEGGNGEGCGGCCCGRRGPPIAGQVMCWVVI